MNILDFQLRETRYWFWAVLSGQFEPHDDVALFLLQSGYLADDDLDGFTVAPPDMDTCQRYIAVTEAEREGIPTLGETLEVLGCGS